MLLVTWTPVPQDKGAVAAASAAGADSTLPVQGYTVCLNERSLMEVDGASSKAHPRFVFQWNNITMKAEGSFGAQ